jgi:spermidine/putrescine transport system ATP-binding protein
LVTFQNPCGFVSATLHNSAIAPGQEVTVAVRREYIELLPVEKLPAGNLPADNSAAMPGLSAVVKEKRFAGGVLQIIAVLADGSEVVASRHGIDSTIKPGDKVLVTWAPENAVIVDSEEPI